MKTIAQDANCTKAKSAYAARFARSLDLQCNRFDIEPEITAKLLLAGNAIVERPVSFKPRSRAAGKKINWRDGVRAIDVLLRCRLGRPATRVAAGLPSVTEPLYVSAHQPALDSSSRGVLPPASQGPIQH